MPVIGIGTGASTGATKGTVATGEGGAAMPRWMAKVNVTAGPFVPLPEKPDQGVAVTVCTPIDS